MPDLCGMLENIFGVSHGKPHGSPGAGTLHIARKAERAEQDPINQPYGTGGLGSARIVTILQKKEKLTISAI